MHAHRDSGRLPSSSQQQCIVEAQIGSPGPWWPRFIEVEKRFQFARSPLRPPCREHRDVVAIRGVHLIS